MSNRISYTDLFNTLNKKVLTSKTGQTAYVDNALIIDILETLCIVENTKAVAAIQTAWEKMDTERVHEILSKYAQYDKNEVLATFQQRAAQS